MSNFENSGPAFPSNRDMRYEQEFDREGGMTLRQYAAVKMEAAYRVMVDRFLSWKLPQDFGPDAGISFTPPPRLPDLYWPTGTNLFHAGQALEMFKHCVELPSAAAVRLAQKNLFDAQEAAKTITKQVIAAEAERDALAAKLAELEGQTDNLLSACHRLALELECLLLDTKDSASVSRWWDSAMAALDEWHKVKDSVSAEQPMNAQQERLLQDMHDAGREIDRAPALQQTHGEAS